MGAVVTAEPYLSKNHAQPGQAPVHARRSRRGEGVRRGHLHGGAGDSVDRDYGWADTASRGRRRVQPALPARARPRRCVVDSIPAPRRLRARRSFVENPAVKLYAHGAFEELMTFADASSNSSTLPAEIGLAYNRMHHWAYTDTFNSYAGRIFNAADEVDTPIHMTFGNATHGMLRATSPDDQWLITKL